MNNYFCKNDSVRYNKNLCLATKPQMIRIQAKVSHPHSLPRYLSLSLALSLSLSRSLNLSLSISLSPSLSLSLSLKLTQVIQIGYRDLSR
jgi:hypothetical protein